MKPPEWIICERTNRWAASIRHAWNMDYPARRPSPRIVETRNLADAVGALRTAPASFVAIEVRRQTLAEVLPWLAKTSDAFSQSRFVALVDQSFDIRSEDGEHDQGTLELIATALCEAGTLHVARSPRNLRTMLELAERHFQTQASIGVVSDSSPIQRVWDSLPWQAG